MMDFQSTNMTDCIRYINRNLGTKLIIPELSVSEISRIVNQESLVTYSKYFPYVLRVPINEDAAIPGKMGFYKIPNLDMLEVIRMRMMIGNSSYAFTNGTAQMPMSMNPIAAQLYDDYISSVMTPLTWTYWAPNIFERSPKVGNVSNMLLELDVVHPGHLRTIGLAMREHFYRLCLLDVLISLQPLRHRFENMSSEYGSISLFLDKIDSASSERESLLQLFEQRAMFTGHRRRIYFA